MRRLKLSLVTLLTVFSLTVGALLPATQVAGTVGLGDVKKDACTHNGGTVVTGPHGGYQDCTNVKNGFTQTITKIVSILLFIIGIIAVVAMVIGGVMYATSGGNSEQIKKAKDTILYAIIGIIVAVMAYAIVGFITQNI